jgi:hypothetical protein
LSLSGAAQALTQYFYSPYQSIGSIVFGGESQAFIDQLHYLYTGVGQITFGGTVATERSWIAMYYEILTRESRVTRSRLYDSRIVRGRTEESIVMRESSKDSGVNRIVNRGSPI